MPDYPSRSTPADYASIFRKRIWWTVAVLLLCLGLGVAYLAVAPKTYTSTASVLVTSSVGLGSGNATSGRTNDAVNLDTEAQIIKSTPVAMAAAELLRTTTSPLDLVKSLDVTVPANTTVMSITFTAPTAEGALQGAHAFAQAYLDSRKAEAQGNVDAQAKALQDQLDAKQKQLTTVINSQAALPNNSQNQAQRALLEAQRQVLMSQVQDLTSDLQTLQTSAVTPGTILVDAQLPTSPSSPVRTMVLGGALALGLIFGLGLALLVDALDRKVRRTGDVRAANLPVIVSRLQAAKNRSIATAASRDATLYAQSQVSVRGGLPDGRGVVQIAPVGTRAGSVVAANLAVSLARSGVRTVLVAPRSHSLALRLIGVPVDSSSIEYALKPNHEPIEPPTRGQPRGVLIAEGLPLVADEPGHASMETLFAQLRQTFDVIIVDVPAVDQHPTGLTLSTLADLIVVVVEQGRTVRSDLDDVVERLAGFGARVAGAIVVAKGRKSKEHADLPSRSASAPRAAAPVVPPMPEHEVVHPDDAPAPR